MVDNTSEDAATDSAEDTNEQPWWKAALSNLPLGELKSEATNYAKAYAEKGASSLTDKLNGLSDTFSSDGGGASQEGLKKGAEKLAEGKNPAAAGASALATGAKEKLAGGSSGGGGSGGSANLKKFSNIVGSIDVGVPITVAYNQWTQYEDWPDFMKKVENAEQEEPEQEEAAEVEIKGKVLFSHRTWKSTVIQQVPDEQIVWESKGEKGHLDGAVTFHELGPRLTRILVIVNYYPQGFVEKFGNAWRPVGRRIHLNMKQFARHVMTTTILDEDAVEGWRGEVRDKEVVRTHEEVVEAEQADAEEPDEQEQSSPEDVDSAADLQDDPDGEAEDDGSVTDPDAEQGDDSEDDAETADEDEEEENVEEGTEPTDEDSEEDTEPTDEDSEEDTEASDEDSDEDTEASDEVSDEPEDDEDFVYIYEDSDTTKGTS